MPVEGRGLGSRRTQQVARDRGLGNLATPKRVQKLQMALHAKAKAEAGYRFYALYDKLSREDILAHAYAQCRSNKGAPGVDAQDFADIEAHGAERWLPELALSPMRGTEDTHDPGARPAGRHPAGLAPLTTAGEHLHAPVRVGVEEARP